MNRRVLRGCHPNARDARADDPLLSRHTAGRRLARRPPGFRSLSHRGRRSIRHTNRPSTSPTTPWSRSPRLPIIRPSNGRRCWAQHPVYSASRLRAQPVVFHDRLAPPGRRRPERHGGPTIRLPAASLLNPGQFYERTQSLADLIRTHPTRHGRSRGGSRHRRSALPRWGDTSPVNSSSSREGSRLVGKRVRKWDLILEFLDLQGNPVTASTRRIDWERPRFKLSGARTAIPALAARPRAAPYRHQDLVFHKNQLLLIHNFQKRAVVSGWPSIRLKFCTATPGGPLDQVVEAGEDHDPAADDADGDVAEVGVGRVLGRRAGGRRPGRTGCRRRTTR